MSFIIEISNLWRNYKSRRWFQGILWGIVLFILGALLSLYLFYESSSDLEEKYNHAIDELNKTRELIVKYADKDLASIYDISAEELNLISKSNLTIEQTRTIFNNTKSYSESTWFNALGYFQIQDYNRSMYYTDLALSLDPQNVDYLIFKGYLLYYFNDYETALTYITLERLKSNNQTAPWLIRTIMLDRLGKHNESLQTHLAYYPRCRGKVDCNYFSIGIADDYFMLGKYNESIKWLDKVNISYLSLTSEVPVYVFLQQKARTYTEAKRYNEAEKIYIQALKSIDYNEGLVIENLDVFKTLSLGACWAQLWGNKLTVIGDGIVKMCVLKDPETNETIFQSQYDEERNAFILNYVFNLEDR